MIHKKNINILQYLKILLSSTGKKITENKYFITLMHNVLTAISENEFADGLAQNVFKLNSTSMNIFYKLNWKLNFKFQITFWNEYQRVIDLYRWLPHVQCQPWDHGDPSEQDKSGYCYEVEVYNSYFSLNY